MFKRTLAPLGVALACTVLMGSDCGPGEPEFGCNSDFQCSAGEYCRDADGMCYAQGYCELPVDCSQQNLIVPACVGHFNCNANQCAWTCTAAPGMGQTCGDGDLCAAGLTCVHYFGIAGPSGPEFRSCERPCSSSDPCPSGTSCVTIADGPGSVCRSASGN